MARLKDIWENKKELELLCLNFTRIANEYLNKGQQPDIKETAQKLGLTIDEYSEFLNWWKNDGYKAELDTQFESEYLNGAEDLNLY